MKTYLLPSSAVVLPLLAICTPCLGDYLRPDLLMAGYALIGLALLGIAECKTTHRAR